MREEIRDRQAFSRASMVFCRSDKDRRDASDGATFVLDARYRIQEDASRIKDKGKRIKVGGAGSGRKIRDKRQETSNPSLGLQWFSVGRIRAAGTHSTGRSLVAS